MTNLGRARRALVALVAVVAVAGCTSGDPIAAPTNTAPAPTTTTTQSLAQKQAAEAEEAVVRALALVDGLAQDPDSTFNAVATVARDRAAAQWRQDLVSLRSKGLTQVGDRVIVDSSAEPTTSQQYAVTVCLDVSGVDVVDAKGKSVVPTSRPSRDENQYTVQETSAGWFVVDQRVDSRSISC